MTPAELSRAVLSTVRRAVAARELRVPVPDRVVVQRPPRPGCGDYATNVALQLAGAAGRSPYEVAQILSRRLSREPGIAQVEIAGPGFLNITLDARAYGDVVRQVRAQGPAYGSGDGLTGERAVVLAAGDGVRGRVMAEAVNRLLRAAGAGPQEQPAGPDAAAGRDAVPGPVRRETLAVAETSRTYDELRAVLGPDATHWALLRPPAEDPPFDPAGLDDPFPAARGSEPTSHPAGRPSPAGRAAGLLTQRESNPLFRLRYAHARTRAMLRGAHDLGVDTEGPQDPDRTPYQHPAETELLGLIADFPRVIETAARRRAPDRLARHLERLADAYLRFQDECPPLPKGDEKPSAVHAARVRLADATGIVLANGLHLLGISAPDHL